MRKGVVKAQELASVTNELARENKIFLNKRKIRDKYNK